MNFYASQAHKSALALAILLTGCGESNFSANATKKAPSTSNSADAVSTPSKQEESDTSTEDREPQHSDKPDLNTCVAAKAPVYRFSLVFDSSLSMKKTDPSNVRMEGAKLFVEHLLQVSNAADVTFEVSTVDFAGEAKINGGWSKVSDDTLAGINASIEAATSISKTPGTNYDAALGQLPDLFAAGDNPDARSFVIFMSDGEPTSNQSTMFFSPSDPNSPSNITKTVSDIVENSHVSFVTIAAGSSIGPSGIELLDHIALPKSGDQQGMFRVAKVADDMRDIWSNLLRDTTGCK